MHHLSQPVLVGSIASSSVLGFHNIKLTGEAAAANHIAAEEFSQTLFKKFITDGGYTPKQVLDVYKRQDYEIK